MSLSTVPHLNFRGQAHEALAFYQSVFGGELSAVTYEQAGSVRHPGDAGQVIWGQVVSGDGFQVMACDVPADTPWHPGEHAFFVSVRGDTPQEITERWDRLAVGARAIVQALGPSAWSPLYGMLKDRFGVVWLLDVVAGGRAA